MAIRNPEFKAVLSHVVILSVSMLMGVFVTVGERAKSFVDGQLFGTEANASLGDVFQGCRAI